MQGGAESSTIPQDRTNTQAEYCDTQLRDVISAAEKLFHPDFFVHIVSRHTRHANATLVVVRHHRHQQRERHQHERAHMSIIEYWDGPADRARHIHDISRATSARYTRPDLADSRRHRLPDADAPSTPHGHPGLPWRPPLSIAEAQVAAAALARVVVDASATPAREQRSGGWSVGAREAGCVRRMPEKCCSTKVVLHEAIGDAKLQTASSIAATVVKLPQLHEVVDLGALHRRRAWRGLPVPHRDARRRLRCAS